MLAGVGEKAVLVHMLFTIAQASGQDGDGPPRLAFRRSSEAVGAVRQWRRSPLPFPGGCFVPDRTPSDVLRLIQDEGVEIVDFRFCDLPGLMQHFSAPVHQLTEDGFEEGYGFDGSSIRGFQEIQESDMLLMPDPNTAVLDPFTTVPTLVLICDVKDPVTGEWYTRDPRRIAKKAEN